MESKTKSNEVSEKAEPLETGTDFIQTLAENYANLRNGDISIAEAHKINTAAGKRIALQNKLEKNHKLSIAFHEAGHVIAMVLTSTPFKYVEIKQRKEKNGMTSLGRVVRRNKSEPKEEDDYFMLNPVDLMKFFKEDFIGYAGIVSGKLHSGKINILSGVFDKDIWAYNNGPNIPKKLTSKYERFMLEYTSQVLQLKQNWFHITAVAIALVNKEKLSYEEVIEIIRQNYCKLIDESIKTSKAEPIN